METVLKLSEEERIAVEFKAEQLKAKVATTEEEVRKAKEESTAVILASEAEGRSMAEQLKNERELRQELELRVEALTAELKKEVELRVTAEEVASVDRQIAKDKDVWKIEATKSAHEADQFKKQMEQLQKQLEHDKAYHDKMFLIEETKRIGAEKKLFEETGSHKVIVQSLSDQNKNLRD